MLTNVQIAGNTATQGNGGGIYNLSSSPTLTNVQITGNKASQSGGGIYNNSSIAAVLTNVTVAGNYAAANYGGIYFSNTAVQQVRNSIIYGNTSAGSSPNVNGYYYVVYAHTLLEGATPDGNVISGDNPQFVSLNPATSSGAVAGGNYRLELSSPAINRGDNAFFDPGKTPDLSAVVTDLDGNPRIYGANIDLGAFEIQSAPSVTIAAVNDTALTVVDTPATVKVLANDNLGACSDAPLDAFALVAGYEPRHGAAAFSVDTLIYTPAAGHYGIDSLDYSFTCNGVAASARAYVLTLKPLSKEYRACPAASVELGFEAVAGVSYTWTNIAGTPVSNTAPVTKDASGNVQTYYVQPSWKGMEFPLCTVELLPAADNAPAVADVRVTLCPLPSRTLYLTSYLDSLPDTSPVQWTTTGVYPAVHDAATGELHTSEFSVRGTFTYSYTRYSECLTSSAVGKAYVHVPTGKIPPRPDTVLVCLDQAAAVNINALFGLDLAGVWSYDQSVNPDNSVANNTVATPSGAVFFDGAKAFPSASDPAYNATYRGVAGKAFAFEYNYSSGNCVAGTKKIVVVVYEK